ncbi:7-deoxyloganetin glucosyltransferase-like isoform X1 [Apium graveolens]|uniref:7-deoxyloganetin glucosyltransferase-like isoform X1 n=1 Tax=Apium graveolens TaxID=4045 RepID=UPI003D7A582F
MVLVKPISHVVCMPFPGQGHITPMLTLAKLLHTKGIYITFVHTDFSHRRSLRSHSPVGDSPTFRFETIPDGLTPPPLENPDAFPNAIELCVSTAVHCLAPFRDLVNKLNNSPGVPPVTCIISDATMSFTLEVSQELGIPNVFFWTVNAFTVLCYLHFSRIRNLASQLQKEAASTDVKNAYLDYYIDWLQGMGSVRLRDISSMIWEPALPDCFVEYCITEISRGFKASAIILNTFDALECKIVNQISKIMNLQVYSIGPIHSLYSSVNSEDSTKSIKFNLWKEDSGCVEWLDSKEAGSVIYVNFGSTTVMSPKQLEEFAWGLANSKQNFLWIIRPNLVIDNDDDSPALPSGFVKQTQGRGLLASWCDQQQVLSHLSIGGFLTHCGWNSTLESLAAGVPMICWPFFADQPSVRHCVCKLWRVGIEVEEDVQREGVEKVVRELMEEENGKEMKKRALEWKGKSESTILSSCSGSSYLDVDRLVNEVILSNIKN